MNILENIKVPTGNILIVSGAKGKLEMLSIGDYGKSKNLKADFYIIWVMPWSEFFIIPQEVVKNRGQTLSFTKTNSPTANKGLYRFKDCWNLLSK